MLKMEGSVFLVFVIFAVLPSLLAATNWSPSLVCHVPLELRIFADPAYHATSANLNSCTEITLSTTRPFFLPVPLTAEDGNEKRSMQLLMLQTPRSNYRFSLRMSSSAPGRSIRTLFDAENKAATALVEFLRVNKFKSFDLAWGLVESAPDYMPILKNLRSILNQQGFSLTTTIGVEVDGTNETHVANIASLVDRIFLVPASNIHYNAGRYLPVTKLAEQAFDSLELNEGKFIHLYNSLNLSRQKVVVGSALQTMIWKASEEEGVTPSNIAGRLATLELQAYHKSCEQFNRTWEVLPDQPSPFYHLAVSPSKDQWMVHVNPVTLDRRIRLILQYGFGGVALYDYYQDDFNGVCGTDTFQDELYPMIKQAGISVRSASVMLPELDLSSGLCIPFLGLTSGCHGAFNGLLKTVKTPVSQMNSTTTKDPVLSALLHFASTERTLLPDVRIADSSEPKSDLTGSTENPLTTSSDNLLAEETENSEPENLSTTPQQLLPENTQSSSSVPETVDSFFESTSSTERRNDWTSTTFEVGGSTASVLEHSGDFSEPIESTTAQQQAIRTSASGQVSSTTTFDENKEDLVTNNLEITDTTASVETQSSLDDFTMTEDPSIFTSLYQKETSEGPLMTGPPDVITEFEVSSSPTAADWTSTEAGTSTVSDSRGTTFEVFELTKPTADISTFETERNVESVHSTDSPHISLDSTGRIKTSESSTTKPFNWVLSSTSESTPSDLRPTKIEASSSSERSWMQSTTTPLITGWQEFPSLEPEIGSFWSWSSTPAAPSSSLPTQTTNIPLITGWQEFTSQEPTASISSVRTTDDFRNTEFSDNGNLFSSSTSNSPLISVPTDGGVISKHSLDSSSFTHPTSVADSSVQDLSPTATYSNAWTQFFNGETAQITEKPWWMNRNNRRNDNRSFYESSYGEKHWSNNDSTDGTVFVRRGKNPFRVALSFGFPFFGHLVNSITIVPRFGFIEVAEPTMFDSSIIAPLSARFLGTDRSLVTCLNNGTALTVRWEGFVLYERPEAGDFSFEVTIFDSGDIEFAYDEIPVPVSTINYRTTVIVGLSYTFPDRETSTFVTRKKILYESHQVADDQWDRVTNGSLISFKALPTCLSFTSCDTCVSASDFECVWRPWSPFEGCFERTDLHVRNAGDESISSSEECDSLMEEEIISFKPPISPDFEEPTSTTPSLALAPCKANQEISNANSLLPSGDNEKFVVNINAHVQNQVTVVDFDAKKWVDWIKESIKFQPDRCRPKLRNSPLLLSLVCPQTEHDDRKSTELINRIQNLLPAIIANLTDTTEAVEYSTHVYPTTPDNDEDIEFTSASNAPTASFSDATQSYEITHPTTSSPSEAGYSVSSNVSVFNISTTMSDPEITVDKVVNTTSQVISQLTFPSRISEELQSKLMAALSANRKLAASFTEPPFTAQYLPSLWREKIGSSFKDLFRKSGASSKTIPSFSDARQTVPFKRWKHP